MKLDLMAFGAHPDDCELSIGGTLLVLKSLNYRLGICDLSSGEMGTHGSSEDRKRELKKASGIVGLDARVTLDLPDGGIRDSQENRMKIIDVIREYSPGIVFGFIDKTRHPDHHHAGELVKECSFLAGLQKIKSRFPAHRPHALFQFPELIPWQRPDFVVDISEVWEKKMDVLRCYRSQFTTGHVETEPPKTFLKSRELWELLEAKARMAGSMIGVKYGEPFYSARPLRVSDPFGVAPREFT